MATARTIGVSKWALGTLLRAAMAKNNKMKVFSGYQPEPTGVFLPVYSKSGTNSLMQMTLQLAWHGAKDFERVHELVTWQKAWPEAPFSGITPLVDSSVRLSTPNYAAGSWSEHTASY